MKRYLFTIIILNFLLSGLIHAENVPIELSTRIFYQNKPFQLTVKLPEEGSAEKVPQSKDYKLHYLGVSPFVSSSISIVNGKVTRKSEKSFNYIYQVTPLKKTQIKIGSFTFKGSADIYTTEPIVINVSKQSQAQSLGQRQVIRLFMEMRYPGQYLYRNKAAVIEARVYSDDRQYIESAFQESQKLVVQKSLVYDISDSLQDEPTRYTNVNGLKLFYRTVKRYVIFPVETGDIQAQAPVINTITPYGIQRLQQENFLMQVVDPLKGPGLTYIGDLEAETEYYELPFRTGDKQEFKIILRGNGNLQILSHPLGSVRIPGLFISQPKVRLEYEEWKNGEARFVQTLNYTMSAQEAGDFVIPEVVLNYVDEKFRKKSVTLTAMKVSVLSNNHGQEDNQILLNQVKSSKKLFLPWSNPIYIILVVLLGFLPLVGKVYGAYRQRLSTDSDFARRQFADRKMEKVFKEVQAAGDKQDWKQFYHLLYTRVLDYIRDKYSLSAGLKVSEVLKALVDKSWDESAVQELNKQLKSWSSMAYSPLLNGEQAEKDLKAANKLIRELKG